MFLIGTHITSIFVNGISFSNVTILISILVIVAVIREMRNLYSISILLFGVGCVLTLPEMANLAPFGIFFLGLYYFRDKSIGLMVFPVALVFSFLLSYIVNGFCDPINLIEGIMGNLFMFFLFYFMFLKQSGDIWRLSKTTPLTRRQLLILRQLDKDIPRKEIPGSVRESELWSLDLEKEHFTLAVINTEISRIKNKLDIKSEFCLGTWYKEKIDVKK